MTLDCARSKLMYWFHKNQLSISVPSIQSFMAIFYTCHGLNLVPKNAQANCIVHSHQNYMFPRSTFGSLSPNSNSNILGTKNANSWTSNLLDPPFFFSPEFQKEVQTFYLYENSVWNSFWNCSWDWDFAANTTSSRNPLCGNSLGTRDRYISKFSAASFFLSCRL